MTPFEQAFDYLMVNEGGYVNDPDDSGGATRYGITDATAKRHRLDVHTLTVDQAKYIYRLEYWAHDWIRSVPLAIKVFDAGVNMGVGTGFGILQRACNVMGAGLAVDGKPGPLTKHAVNSRDPDELMQHFVTEMADHYIEIVKRIPKNKKFLKGWLKRARRIPEV